jgi:FixJ family two-component response regulator
MRWLLESEGFAVATFSSALDFLSNYQPGRPGCLLLDLELPDMGGLELQQLLVSRGLELPIIFLTGHGDASRCATAMTAGAVDFIEKPADDRKLLECIDRALHIRRTPREARG